MAENCEWWLHWEERASRRWAVMWTHLNILLVLPSLALVELGAEVGRRDMSSLKTIVAAVLRQDPVQTINWWPDSPLYQNRFDRESPFYSCFHFPEFCCTNHNSTTQIHTYTHIWQLLDEFFVYESSVSLFLSFKTVKQTEIRNYYIIWFCTNCRQAASIRGHILYPVFCQLHWVKTTIDCNIFVFCQKQQLFLFAPDWIFLQINMLVKLWLWLIYFFIKKKSFSKWFNLSLKTLPLLCFLPSLMQSTSFPSKMFPFWVFNINMECSIHYNVTLSYMSTSSLKRTSSESNLKASSTPLPLKNYLWKGLSNEILVITGKTIQ